MLARNLCGRINYTVLTTDILNVGIEIVWSVYGTAHISDMDINVFHDDYLSVHCFYKYRYNPKAK